MRKNDFVIEWKKKEEKKWSDGDERRGRWLVVNGEALGNGNDKV